MGDEHMTDEAEGNRVCSSNSCGLVFEGGEANCPQCGSRADSQSSIRQRGAMATVYGLLFVFLMAGLALTVLPFAPRLGEAPDDRLAMANTFGYAIFGAGAAFGVMMMINGLYQNAHGKRSWKLVRGLFIVLLLVPAFSLIYRLAVLFG